QSCGKLFKNSEEVEFHAVKSGHSAFSESKEEKRPLTDEEKKQKLKDLEEKLKQRRREKEEEEKREIVEREKKRIVMSKNILETKRRVEDQEIRRVAEERRREKKEDQMARQRVKEQIERDKLARKEMFSGGAKTPAPPAASQPPKPVAAPGQKKEYDCTRLQIRLPSGTPLVQEFKSREALSAVRLWIGLNRPDRASDAFRLSTTFPRKVFSEEDMDKPLTVLGTFRTPVFNSVYDTCVL
ncbi:UNVERIFIED_CONTAM: hypothetical protein GTU68_036217, partial [Idotea baltica]|nr:hypothetical protein [Idotea baltica]